MMKRIFIAAGIMIISGAVISAAAYGLGAGRSNEHIEYKTEDISAENLEIRTEYKDVSVVRGDKLAITYPDGENTSFSSAYNGDTYTAEHKRKKYNIFGSELDVFLDLSQEDEDRGILLEVPEDFTGEIEIGASAGNVSASEISGKLRINVSAGSAELTNCSDTEVKADSGSISANGLSGNIKLEASLGDIRISDCSGDIKLICDMGEIHAENVEGRSIYAHNSWGDIDLTINGSESEYKVNGIGEGEKTIEASAEMGEKRIRFMK